jgi:ABC-2 type transport system permease protein
LDTPTDQMVIYAGRLAAQVTLRALLPMVMHVMIALAAGYAVGIEFQRRSMRRWLACAGGNPIVALTGKLAHLLGIFLLIMLATTLVIEGSFGPSFKGDATTMIIGDR